MKGKEGMCLDTCARQLPCQSGLLTSGLLYEREINMYIFKCTAFRDFVLSAELYPKNVLALGAIIKYKSLSPSPGDLGSIAQR